MLNGSEINVIVVIICIILRHVLDVLKVFLSSILEIKLRPTLFVGICALCIYVCSNRAIYVIVDCSKLVRIFIFD